jgi:hypothetical protein
MSDASSKCMMSRRGIQFSEIGPALLISQWRFMLTSPTPGLSKSKPCLSSPTPQRERVPPTTTTSPHSQHPHYTPIQQSQALRLAPQRCWPGQVCALRAPSVPQGPPRRTLRYAKYTQRPDRAIQVPENTGNGRRDDGRTKLIHMGANG